MWKNPPPCRAHPYCPMARPRPEHRIYLIFDYHGGGADPLPCENARTMPLETAKLILRAGARTAEARGKDLLLAELLGGDPFARLDDLRALCAWAWEELGAVRFELRTTLDRLTEREAAWQWYVDHRDKILLWLRCGPLDGGSLDFAVHTGCGLEYAVDPAAPANLREDLSRIQEHGVPLRFAPPAPDGELTEEYAEVLEQLHTLPRACDLPWGQELLDRFEADLGAERDPVSGQCYDTNGWIWPCPALSPVRLHSWSMEDGLLQEAAACPKGPLDWMCPGELLRAGQQREALRVLRLYQQNVGIKALLKLGSRDLILWFEQLRRIQQSKKDRKEG